MVKILWFSRHDMTRVQEDELKRIYGKDIYIEHIFLTIKHASEVKDAIDRNDVIAITAPIYLREEFIELAGNKPVLIAKSKRLLYKSPKDRNRKKSRIFIFDGWYQIMKLKLEMKKL